MAAVKYQAPRATCPHCNRTFTLRVDNRLPRHGHTAVNSGVPWTGWCPGSELAQEEKSA